MRKKSQIKLKLSCREYYAKHPSFSLPILREFLLHSFPYPFFPQAHCIKKIFTKMAIKDAYQIALLLDRVSLVLYGLSFIYLAVSIQTSRFSNKTNPAERSGVFPFTWFFVFCFIFETFVRSGSLFAEDNTTLLVFNAMKPYFEKNLANFQIPDFLLFSWNNLGFEEHGNRFMLRVLCIAFSMFLLVNRLSLGSGSDQPGRNFKYMLKAAITITAFASLCALATRSCGEMVLRHKKETLLGENLKLEPNFATVVRISELSQVCLQGPIGIGDAMITIALLHASISWTKSSWIGLQHVLAYRWASVMVHMYALHLKGLLLDEIIKPKYEIESQSQAIATVIQVGAVFGLFVLKFAIRQPLAFSIILAIISAASAVTLGTVPVPVELAFHLQPILGQLFVFFAVTAILLTGGIGISFAMFTVVGSASIQAPWLRAMLERK
jgi:hypothetical protein